MILEKSTPPTTFFRQRRFYLDPIVLTKKGDIVEAFYKNSTNKKHIYLIKWDRGEFVGEDFKGDFFDMRNTRCKVIGNIHDNPELLKEEGEDEIYNI